MTASRRAGLLVSAAILCLGAAQARAQKQIVTAINSSVNGGAVVTNTSVEGGKTVSVAAGDSSGRALTDFGVNKVFAKSTGGHEQTVSSAWLDTFTVQGPANQKVKLTFSFTVDGSASFGDRPADIDLPEYNFKVYALRGAGWTLNGHDQDSDGRYTPRLVGDDYGEMFLQRVTPGGVVQLDMDNDKPALTTFANVNGTPGNFVQEVSYDPKQDMYRQVRQFGENYGGSYYYKTGFKRGGADTPPDGPLTPYTGSNEAVGAGQQRAVFENFYNLYDSAALCDDGEGSCSERVWEPTTLTLSFEAMSGTSVAIAAWMFADDVTNGTVDFFNTAKLSRVDAADATGAAVALISESGALRPRPGGGYGYIAAGIPEPATWAMMILGMGAVGGTMRRRACVTITYA
jgi:hypothetical protein